MMQDEKTACFAWSIIGNSKSYLVQPSILSPSSTMVWPTSVAVVTAVMRGVQVKAGVASRAMALAMGLGVCSPPHGYLFRESCTTPKNIILPISIIKYIYHTQFMIIADGK